MKTRILVLATIIALVGVTSGFAQLNDIVRANIPFAFTVGKTVLPAGEYDFSKNALDTAIYVKSAKKGGPNGEALVLTRLGGEVNSAAKFNVVFDQIGDQYTFAELWLPGADGYLINMPQAKHAHRTVTVPAK